MGIRVGISTGIWGGRYLESRVLPARARIRCIGAEGGNWARSLEERGRRAEGAVARGLLEQVLLRLHQRAIQ